MVLLGSCLHLNGTAVQAATLSKITVTGAHHDLGVTIAATAGMTPRIETATKPDRLIVDLPDVLPSVGLQKILVNRGKLKDIRVGLFSANPRIRGSSLTLLAEEYRLLPLRNSLIVNLGEEAGPAIDAISKLPIQTRSAESMPVVATPLPPFSSERSRARWILPILTMSTVLTMLVCALVSHIQNAQCVEDFREKCERTGDQFLSDQNALSHALI